MPDARHIGGDPDKGTIILSPDFTQTTGVSDSPPLTVEEARKLLDDGVELSKKLAPRIAAMQGDGPMIPRWPDPAKPQKFWGNARATGAMWVGDSPPTEEHITAQSPKSLDSSHKIPVNLCPASAIIAIALVITQGHKKPGRTIYNWRDPNQKISWMEYDAAIERHLMKARDGEDFDEELSQLAGVPIRHEWAAMSGMAIVEDARQAGTLVDDRPTKGGAAKFLHSITVKK